MEKNKIKILVGYHKPATLLKSEILVPIHLGRAVINEQSKDAGLSNDDKEWLLSNMIGDDTGDNISYLNRYFCEMTGIYWAWKNYDKLGNPEYFGFMHYRRHFIFNNSEIKKQRNKHFYSYENLNDEYINEIGLLDNIIYKALDNFDCVFTEPVYIGKNVREDYNDLVENCYLSMDDFDLSLNYAIDNMNIPKYTVSQFLDSKDIYCCNMFIMKKDIFFKYCEFIFEILFYAHNNIDYSYKTMMSNREVGFIAERLTGLFFNKTINDNLYKIKFLPITRVDDTNIIPTVKPIYANSIPVVFSCDNNYITYLSVVLQSLMDNCSLDKFYEIFILHSELDKNVIEKLNSMITLKNIVLKFINVSYFVDKIKKLHDLYIPKDKHFQESTYYRFFIPEIFSAYDKIIYLDTDILILDDLSKLYEVDLNDNILGACLDIGFLIDMNLNNHFYNKVNHRLLYVKNVLKLNNIYDYFQAGVLLYDIKKCKEIDFTNVCFKELQRIRKPSLVDQDVLNSAFEGRIKFLDIKWNWTWNLPIRFNENKNINKNYLNATPFCMLQEYENVRDNQSIIHYCDNFKPWFRPELPLAYKWWEYARKTIFYEEILVKLYNWCSYNHLINTIEKVVIPEKQKLFGARARAENYLQYKIGKALLNARNPLKAIILPITLYKINKKHKKELELNKSLVALNPKLKAPKIEEYADYNEAVKVMNNLPYKLGGLFIKHPITFIFKARKFCKEHKSGK